MSDNKETNIQKLREKLSELFQLDRGDLDFGLYRVMSLKRAEVNQFVDEQLLPQVEAALGDIANADEGRLKEKLDELREAASELGVQPDENEKIQEIQREINDNKRLEADAYNHLYNFFSRYYEDGDFMPLRRYKGIGKEAYAVPYNGEEVKLLWANSDQYYIKTTENYSSYIFIPDDSTKKRVRFEIQAADNEKDVVKETKGNGRLFMLAPGKDSIVAKGNQLTVRFDHRPLTSAEKTKYKMTNKQEAINQETQQRVLDKLPAEWTALLAQPAPTQDDEQRSLLEKHLNTYTAKNSFDYFIHKDLGGFLRRELYTYLKNEVILIDNIEITDDPIVFKRNLAQLKAIKGVGNKIIDFLAQLEDFQKQLYLKKKFVLETQYCVTLDRVPSSLYPEIAKNKAQVREWVDLFAIDEINGDMATTAYSNPLKPAFLEENPHLVLDTRYFNEKFKDELLAALSEAGSIDEQSNGLIVHGDNFQALNLMQARYREQVQCIYIDPPYNTDSSAILYKNGYKDSSWLTLMENRVKASHSLLNDDGIICVAIDDEEVSALRILLEDTFMEELGVATVCSNPRGRKTKGKFAPAHEYALFYGKTEASLPGYLGKTEQQKQHYRYEDELGHFTWMGFVRTGTNDRREDRPKLFYPIFVQNKSMSIRVPQDMEWDDTEWKWKHESPEEDEIAVYPSRLSDGQVVDGRWHRGHEGINNESDQYRAVGTNPEDVKIQFKARMDERALPTTWWKDSSYGSSNGTIALNNLMGRKCFDFPKSVRLVEDCIRASNGKPDMTVLDYFGGSGSTGHAIINLNRSNDGNYKYILVEIGHHFENVLLPRMKKVIYSSTWKDGKPKDMSNREGISQLFRYVRLESFEDTLDSLVVHPKADMIAQIQDPQFMEDYQLRYALGAETADSASLLGTDFIEPCNYTLSVVRDGIRRDVPVDLAETFNFLLGLRLATRRRIGNVLVITGVLPKGLNCLILWRNTDKTNNAKLEKWFKKNRDQFGENLNTVYVNGDHTLNAIREDNEQWEAITIEPIFKELMFAQS